MGPASVDANAMPPRHTHTWAHGPWFSVAPRARSPFVQRQFRGFSSVNCVCVCERYGFQNTLFSVSRLLFLLIPGHRLAFFGTADKQSILLLEFLGVLQAKSPTTHSIG